ncbi:MAG TPA: hypothetical protein VK422_17690 [Pyrinomonadaceae bacterium]|nr:hypothetical protein [Pyrinomonadaceae bacterium]
MRRLFKGLFAAVALGCALTVTGAHAQREGRIGTPSDLKCPRDNTTAFTGRVLAYSRGRGRVFIKVRTDEQTTEQFTLHYGRGDFKPLFRLRGEPLAEGDLARIEVRAGRLRPNMRATVWACYKGDELDAERIDWRPPEE